MQIDSLLPLRALSVTLEFTAKARFGPFHQAAVHAFLRHLLDSPAEFDTLLTLDAPESGRLDYPAGARYRFAVYALAGGELLLARLIGRLRGLPERAPIKDRAAPLRDNLRLVELRDLFADRPVEAVADLALYDYPRLAGEAALWRNAPWIRLRWLSPARLLRDKEARGGAKGEGRFCRNPEDLDATLLLKRVRDALADLLRRRGQTPPSRRDSRQAQQGDSAIVASEASLRSPQALTPTPLPRGEGLLAGADDERPPAADDAAAPLAEYPRGLFWLEANYRDAAGDAHPIGGVCGAVDLGPAAGLPPGAIEQLVLAQYAGIGQRRAFGLGRFQLESAEGDYTLALAERAERLDQLAMAIDNLRLAWEVINANLAKGERDEAEEEWSSDPPPEAWRQAIAAEEEERLHDRLEQLAAAVRRGAGPPALDGHVFREKDGDLRALAIPPFWDRVAQRAVTQLLTQVIDAFFYPHSYGYRRGHSRQGAAQAIQKAWREGYRWVYEADIDDFFDSADWRHLENRLRALLRDDPLVERLLAWIAAPVDYQGYRIQRRRGLPQGAPVSPLLANLLLDDFDRDLQHAGFRLVRFADDFIILCKTREQVEPAAREVRRSLAEIGLELNQAKSGPVAFEQGFKYLGYLFLNDMVLDAAGGEGGERPISQAMPPPNSWLARLLEKSARPIEELLAKGTGHRQSRKQPRPQDASGAGEEPGHSDHGGPESSAMDGIAGFGLGERDDLGATLIISGRPAMLSTRNRRLVAERDDETIADTPLSGLACVVLFGGHHVTTPALRAAMAEEVPIHFASAFGRYQGTTWGGESASRGARLWLLQRQRFNDPAFAIHAARAVVMARIRHQREVLRQRRPGGKLKALALLDEAIRQAGKTTEITALNGIEGHAAAVYFAAIAPLIPEPFGFDGRNRRPPRDPFNALLSLGYSLLHAHADTFCRAQGLYPWIGFYHQPRPGHAALASDLMEPFRHLVERTALTALTRGTFTPDDFRLDPRQGCRLEYRALRRYLAMLWERLDTPVQAVGEEEALSPRRQLHAQNQRLIDWLRDGPDFRPWMTR